MDKSNCESKVVGNLILRRLMRLRQSNQKTKHINEKEQRMPLSVLVNGHVYTINWTTIPDRKSKRQFASISYIFIGNKQSGLENRVHSQTKFQSHK